jgi:hypothetical protein
MVTLDDDIGTTIQRRTVQLRPPGFWRAWLIGRPLPTEAAPHQTIGKAIGLAVFASDALFSTAYATQEILISPRPARARSAMLCRFPWPSSACWWWSRCLTSRRSMPTRAVAGVGRGRPPGHPGVTLSPAGGAAATLHRRGGGAPTAERARHGRSAAVRAAEVVAQLPAQSDGGMAAPGAAAQTWDRGD